MSLRNGVVLCSMADAVGCGFTSFVQESSMPVPANNAAINIFFISGVFNGD